MLQFAVERDGLALYRESSKSSQGARNQPCPYEKSSILACDRRAYHLPFLAARLTVALLSTPVGIS